MRKVTATIVATGTVIFAALTAAADLANASETINYSYDAHGRLVRVVRSGTINNGVSANYLYDNADNRYLVNVTGAP